MSEISTRIWLDEPLWSAIRERALARGVTVRELADISHCAVCGQEVKLGAVSQHLGKHRREQ